jgi:hypothetical protein
MAYSRSLRHQLQTALLSKVRGNCDSRSQNPEITLAESEFLGGSDLLFVKLESGEQLVHLVHHGHIALIENVVEVDLRRVETRSVHHLGVEIKVHGDAYR